MRARDASSMGLQVVARLNAAEGGASGGRECRAAVSAAAAVLPTNCDGGIWGRSDEESSVRLKASTGGGHTIGEAGGEGKGGRVILS